MNKLIFHSIFLLGILPFVLAQNDSTRTQGEIISGEVIIEKDKQIILPESDKLYLSPSARTFNSGPIDVELEVSEPQLDWPPYKSDIPYQPVTEEYPLSEYSNYVKLGYGNYQSPLLELGIAERLGRFDIRSRGLFESFGRGPVNDSNSKSAIGKIDITASYKREQIELIPYIDFQNLQYRFYGNTNRINNGFDAEPAPKVNLNEIDAGISLVGEWGDISYFIKPSISFTNQKLLNNADLNRESVAQAYGKFVYKIDDVFNTGFRLEGHSGTYDGGFSYDRSLFVLNPWVSYSKDNLSVEGGFNLASAKSGSSSQSGFYPDVSAKWAFSKDWSAFGKLTGGISWSGLAELMSQNEFLDDSLILLNTETVFEIGGGIDGKLMKNMNFVASLMFSELDNLPFFIPSASDSSRYTITYDSESVSRIRLNVGLTYSPTNTSTYGVNLEINGYSLESLDRPWHLPTYVFKAYTSHNIYEKLILSGKVLAIGGMKAPADVSFGIVNLRSFLDAGISLKYLITQRASAFIDIDNLFNNEYERYLGYPVRGLTFKIGGKYRF